MWQNYYYSVLMHFEEISIEGTVWEEIDCVIHVFQVIKRHPRHFLIVCLLNEPSCKLADDFKKWLNPLELVSIHEQTSSLLTDQCKQTMWSSLGSMAQENLG